MSAPTGFHVVGWRHLTHSFAIVNQWQMLALLKRADVRLSFSDAPLFRSHWRSAPGAFPPEQTAALSSIGPAIEPVDVEYRIQVPFDFTAAPNDRLVLSFAVTEAGVLDGETFRQGTRLADLNASDRVLLVTPSRWSRDRFIDNGVDAQRIRVLPHGVDTGTFRPDAARREEFRRGLDLNEFVFLNVGAMTGNKGIGLLLEAFGVVLEGGTKATLVLKGHDPLYGSRTFLQEKLSAMSERRRRMVVDNLVYIGRPFDMSAMAALYNAADAYVSPYFSEGFNMPVLEAAAAGLPVICTGGGATEDFTSDAFRRNIASTMRAPDGGGRMVDPEFDHLVELMTEIATDKAFALQAGREGPLHVAASYTWDHVAAQLMELARAA